MASNYESEGRTFESFRAHQHPPATVFDLAGVCSSGVNSARRVPRIKRMVGQNIERVTLCPAKDDL